MIIKGPDGAAADYLPLCKKEGLLRHLDIFESLKLDLKIALDGMPELSGLPSRDVLSWTKQHGKGGRAGHRGQNARNAYADQISRAASAVYCHELYFENLTDSANFPSIPTGDAESALAGSFGSMGNFFYLVRTMAVATAFPGFLWLYEKKRDRRRNFAPFLGLERLNGYDVPDSTKRPLLCIDLWEHAYMDTWGTDVSGYADAYLRQTDWKNIFETI